MIVKIFCEQCAFGDFLRKHGYVSGFASDWKGSRPIVEVEVLSGGIGGLSARCPFCGRECFARMVDGILAPVSESRSIFLSRYVLFEGFLKENLLARLMWMRFLGKRRKVEITGTVQSRIKAGCFNLLDPITSYEEVERIARDEFRIIVFLDKIGIWGLWKRWQNWRHPKPLMEPADQPPIGPKWYNPTGRRLENHPCTNKSGVEM